MELLYLYGANRLLLDKLLRPVRRQRLQLEHHVLHLWWGSTPPSAASASAAAAAAAAAAIAAAAAAAAAAIAAAAAAPSTLGDVGMRLRLSGSRLWSPASLSTPTAHAPTPAAPSPAEQAELLAF